MKSVFSLCVYFLGIHEIVCLNLLSGILQVLNRASETSATSSRITSRNYGRGLTNWKPTNLKVSDVADGQRL